MNIVIANRQRTKKVNVHLLKQIAGELLVELKIENAELGINLAGAKEMAALNWKFLRHEGPTDVITFDYDSPVGRAAKRKTRLARTLAPPNLNGELFVCMDESIFQAKQYETDWQSEIVRYIIHGVLHLLGHDDHRVAARKKMKREENRLLRLLAKKFSLAQIAGRSKISA